MAGARWTVRGVLRSMGAGTWTRLDLTRSQSVPLATRGKARVRGAVGGRGFETVAIPNGDGTHSLLFTRPILAATGTRVGSRVVATLEVLRGPRPVRLPLELRRILRRRPAVAASYARLAPSHRRAWAEYVGAAKQAETRKRRAVRAADRIADGDQDPRT